MAFSKVHVVDEVTLRLSTNQQASVRRPVAADGCAGP